MLYYEHNKGLRCLKKIARGNEMENKIKEILASYIDDEGKVQEALQRIMEALTDKGDNTKEPLTVMSFDAYNERRFGKPWIATVQNGKFNFAKDVGYYTAGNPGDAGELVITDINQDYIYTYGQKDYSGNRGFIYFGRIVDGRFVRCDKAGKVIEVE